MFPKVAALAVIIASGAVLDISSDGDFDFPQAHKTSRFDRRRRAGAMAVLNAEAEMPQPCEPEVLLEMATRVSSALGAKHPDHEALLGLSDRLAKMVTVAVPSDAGLLTGLAHDLVMYLQLHGVESLSPKLVEALDAVRATRHKVVELVEAGESEIVGQPADDGHSEAAAPAQPPTAAAPEGHAQQPAAAQPAQQAAAGAAPEEHPAHQGQAVPGEHTQQAGAEHGDQGHGEHGEEPAQAGGEGHGDHGHGGEPAEGEIHLHGHPSPKSLMVYFVEIVVVVFISVSIEMFENAARDHFRRQGKEELVRIMDSMFREIMIMGFIGLIVFILETVRAYRKIGQMSGEDPGAIVGSFHSVHMFLFIVMMVFLLHMTCMVVNCSSIINKWRDWESMSGDEVKHMLELRYPEDHDIVFAETSWGNFVDQGRGIEAVNWLAVRKRFVMAQDPTTRVKVPVDFRFARYLAKRLGELCGELVEIRSYTWMSALLITPIILGGMQLEGLLRPMFVSCGGVVLLIALLVFGLYVSRIECALQLEMPSRIPAISNIVDHNTAVEEMPCTRVARLWEAGHLERAAEASRHRVERQAHRETTRAVMHMPQVAAGRVETPHELLFFRGADGPLVCCRMLQVWLFLHAVWCAMLILCNTRHVPMREWGPPRWSMFITSMVVIYLNLMVLLPRVLEKLTVASNVESIKHRECLREVIWEHQQEKMRGRVKLLRLLKVAAKVSSFGGSLSKDDFEMHLKKFEKLPSSQRSSLVASFHRLEHSNGLLNAADVDHVLSLLGIEDEHETGKLHHELVHLVDRDEDDCITLDEFKVLMSLALGKPDPVAEQAETRAFFKKFDKDGGGSVGMEEIVTQFTELGLEITAEEVSESVRDALGETKFELDVEDFSTWMTHLETTSDLSTH